MDHYATVLEIDVFPTEPESQNEEQEQYVRELVEAHGFSVADISVDMSGNPILTDAFIATEATLFQIEKVEQKLQKWYPTHDVSYTTTYSDGYRRGQAQGALHFDVTKDKGGTVTGAEVTFSGGGQNPVLTVSNGKCERPDEPPEQFDDLTVTDRCVNGNGSITVSNSNDDPITVTVSGPDGYETENEVPAGGSVEFAGLANGTYDLETDDDSVGLNRSTVRIDY